MNRKYDYSYESIAEYIVEINEKGLESIINNHKSIENYLYIHGLFVVSKNNIVSIDMFRVKEKIVIIVSTNAKKQYKLICLDNISDKLFDFLISQL